MPNHLTPEELAEETGMDRDEVLQTCVEEGIPVYKGRIDKYLFSLHVREPAGATA